MRVRPFRMVLFRCCALTPHGHAGSATIGAGKQSQVKVSGDHLRHGVGRKLRGFSHLVLPDMAVHIRKTDAVARRQCGQLPEMAGVVVGADYQIVGGGGATGTSGRRPYSPAPAVRNAAVPFAPEGCASAMLTSVSSNRNSFRVKVLKFPSDC